MPIHMSIYSQHLHKSITYYCVWFQLIFRKLADVKREKELAEKRKNDPPLELSSDHPVRKLISRFRKISDHKLTVNVDAEHNTPNNIAPVANHTAGGANSVAKVINVSERRASSAGKQNAVLGASKWGRLIAGAAQADAKSGTPVDGATPNNAKQENAPAAPRPKPASKWGKLLGKPATIEEGPEDDAESKGPTKSKSNLRHKDGTSVISGALKLSRSQEEGESSSDAPVTQRDVTCSIGGASNLSTEQHVIASLYDIKMEIKEEIDTLNQKMNKIDSQISEILRYFSPSSSPYSTHTSSCCGSSAPSCTSSGTSSHNNSIVTSPKGSQPNSPLKPQTHMPVTSLGSPVEAAPIPATGQERKGTPEKAGPPPTSPLPPSKKSSPVQASARPLPTSSSQESNISVTSQTRESSGQSDTSNGNAGAEGGPSSGRRHTRKRKTSSNRIRVAPLYDEKKSGLGAVVPARDDDSVPMKDRDLDIL